MPPRARSNSQADAAADYRFPCDATLAVTPSVAFAFVGMEHLAFEVDDERDEVDAAYTRCLAGDANVHFPPEEDRDIEDYYAFFVFDPDGIRVEVLWWQRDETSG